MENAAEDEPELPVESDEQVELGRDNDHEEIIEEGLEDDEVEKEEEKKRTDTESKGKQIVHGDEEMKHADTDEEEDTKKHAELLALPEHDSEVYLCGIPHEASEDDLRGFCECIGEVTEIRIIKGNDLGVAEDYASVTFKNKELACKAVEELNNSRLKGKKIKITYSTSPANNRLYIGNVPRNWGDEDMKKVVTNIGPGVVSVEMPMDQQNSSRNRGYAFIEYYNHACAEYSKEKMSTSKIMLDTGALDVNWRTRNAGCPASSQVKAVLVKNLPKDITHYDLERLFDHHGEITNVYLLPAKAGEENSRIGFVLFTKRSSALKALNNTEKYEIGGQVLKCYLANPEYRCSGASNHQNSSALPPYPSDIGYAIGIVGGAQFGSLGTGYGGDAGYAQPLMSGWEPTPIGIPIMPMRFPDGSIIYVLQQPGLQPQFGDGSSSSGGNHSGDTNN